MTDIKEIKYQIQEIKDSLNSIMVAVAYIEENIKEKENDHD